MKDAPSSSGRHIIGSGLLVPTGFTRILPTCLIDTVRGNLRLRPRSEVEAISSLHRRLSKDPDAVTAGGVGCRAPVRSTPGGRSRPVAATSRRTRHGHHRGLHHRRRQGRRRAGALLVAFKVYITVKLIILNN